MKPLGDWLREKREEARKTLRQVAREVGVSAPFWSDVEHRRRQFSAERIPSVAKALGVSAEMVQMAIDAQPCPRCGRCGQPLPARRAKP